MELLIFTVDMQPQIVRFFEKCYAALGWGYEPDGRHIDTTDIETHYMKNGCFWCLSDGESIIGTVALHEIDGENKVFELKRMFVLPEYQGKGCGGRLLEHAINYAKALNYSTIYLDTRNDLAAAQHLYEKHGFQKRAQYNDNSYADIYYELRL